MKILLTLSAIAITILLALLYFNYNEGIQQREFDRQKHQDTLQYWVTFNERIALQLHAAERAKAEQRQKDSVSKMVYVRDLAKLKVELKKARTPRVDTLIEVEPELRWYIAYYDSVNNLQELRIDTLEYEKSMQDRLYGVIIDLKDSLVASKNQEINYLTNTVDTLANALNTEKKRHKRTKVVAAVGWLLNLVPR